MIPYTSASNKESGVTAYETGEHFIIVKFGAATYKYSYSSCGQRATEQMKERARASKGLSTYISKNKPVYEWKQ